MCRGKTTTSVIYNFIRRRSRMLDSVQSDTKQHTHNYVLLKSVDLVRNDAKGRLTTSSKLCLCKDTLAGTLTLGLSTEERKGN